MRALPLARTGSLILVAGGDRYPSDDDDTGSVDTPDEDGDGFGADSGSDADDRAIFPAASEVCDGTDDDCDGTADNGVLGAM